MAGRRAHGPGRPRRGQVVAWATPPPTVSASVGSLNPADPLYSGTQALGQRRNTRGGGAGRPADGNRHLRGEHEVLLQYRAPPAVPLQRAGTPGFSMMGWPDGLKSVVSVRVWQSDGQYTPANSCDSTMWNKADRMYNTDLTYGRQLANYAASSLSGMNHSVVNAGCSDTACQPSPGPARTGAGDC